MFESRQDYLLEMIRRATEALAALLVEVTPGQKVEEEDRALERALDDLFAGLDAHAHRLDPATLRAILRSDERTLLFALLQARKGVRRIEAGDVEGGDERVRCARELLRTVIAGGSPLAEVASPVAAMLADWPA